MEEERKNQESQQRLKDNIAKRKQDRDKKKKRGRGKKKKGRV